MLYYNVLENWGVIKTLCIFYSKTYTPPINLSDYMQILSDPF